MRVKSILRLAGVLAAVLPISLAAQTPQSAAQVPTVTLDEAIQLALRAQPAVVQARGNVDVAQASRRQAIGNWLPSLSVSSGVSKASSTRFNQATGQNVSVAQPFSYSGSFRTSVELFDGLRRFYQNKQAGANAASADAALVTQQFTVTLQTKQQFFAALAAAELERVQGTRVQRAQEQLKISKEKLAAGSAIRSDTLRATVELGSAQLALLNAQTARATAQANLARLIGVDGLVQAVGDSSIIAVVAVDTAQIRAEALRSAPSIAQAEAAKRAADANVNVLRAQYFPSVSVSYSNTRAGTDLGALTPSWNFGLSLSWTLFNGFQRETNLSQNFATRNLAVVQAADARRQVNAQVTQYLAALAAAHSQIAIAQASRGAADEDLRVQRERYRLGAATIVEVLTAQANLDQAEVDAVNARVAYQTAKSQLESLVGRQL